MARNELMAKYMMENSHIADTIEDYCVEISFVEDNLQRGTYEEKNGTTAVLSDFQVIDFKKPIESAKKEDRDKDGLTNENELGEIKWIDVTSFLRKTYNEKLGKGEIVGTFEEHIKKIQEANGYYPDNPNSGHVQVEKDNSGNILSVKYRTYDYKSNPALKDTDFDGMDDKPDKRPLSGAFQGQTDIERSGKLNVDYTNDFRYFFIDNNKYNDELAQMSLIISNLATDTGRKIDLSQGGLQVGRMNVGGYHVGDLNIVNYLDTIGFSSFGNESLYGGEGKVYLCQKVIDYYAERDDKNNLISGEEKLVIGIFIGGFESEKSYKELVVDTDKINNNYEEIINQIVERINNIKSTPAIKTYIDKDKYCYWITGKNISGAVANGVASKLQDKDHTYCYAFASPNVGINVVGSYVKNIINADDIISKIYSEDEGYHINGSKYYKSIKYDMKKEYRQYVGNFNNYKGDYKVTNKSKNDIKQNKDEYGSTPQYNDMINMTNQLLFSDSIIGVTGNYLLCRNDDGIVYAMSLTDIFGDIYNFFKNIVTSIFNGKGKIVSDGQGFKSYDTEVKGLDGFDENTNSEKYSEAQESVGSSDENLGEEDDKRNGYKFITYKDPLLNDKTRYDQNNNDTIHIFAYKFSNYTIPKEYKENDVNYTKFWNMNDNGTLSEYMMGDYGEHTKFTNEKNSDWFNKFLNNNGGFRTYNDNGIWTIDGRIVAAFPSALNGEEKPEFKRTLDDMHLISTHDKTNIIWKSNDKGVNSQKDGGWFLDGNSYSLGGNNMYKLVDCVFEDGNKQQFVVPFIVIDDKMIHLLPNMHDVHYYLEDGISRGGMMGNLTDNRYGQITEYIENENPIRYEYGVITNKHNENDEQIIKKNNIDNYNYNTNIYKYDDKPIIYFDKDETREPITLSPIEPLTNHDMSSEDIMRIIFGDESND